MTDKKFKKIEKTNKKSIGVVPSGDQKLDGIKVIIHKAFERILSCKTKHTYQAELHIISKTIKDFIEISYVSKEKHTEELLTQIFEYVNQLKALETKHSKSSVRQGINLSIKELETNIYVKRKK